MIRLTAACSHCKKGKTIFSASLPSREMIQFAILGAELIECVDGLGGLKAVCRKCKWIHKEKTVDEQMQFSALRRNRTPALIEKRRKALTARLSREKQQQSKGKQ